MYEFESRLQRLIEDPQSLRAFWLELAKPIVRLLDRGPQIETERLRAYVEALNAEGNAALDELKEQAEAEFDTTLRSLERRQITHGFVEPRFMNWSLRIHTTLRHAERAHSHLRHGHIERARAEAEGLSALAPHTLSILESGEMPNLEKLAHANIEALVQAAHAERDFLGRRRNLLQAARELLIDSAASSINQQVARSRLEQIGREIGDLDRLQALGVEPDVALPHQLQAAHAQRHSQRVNAILSTIEHQASVAADEKVRELSSTALETLWQGQNRFAMEHRIHSRKRSGQDTFQAEVLAAAQRGIAAAQTHFEQHCEALTNEYGPAFERVASTFVQDGAMDELIQSALYVDGCVDVGGVLSPHRAAESVTTTRVVRYPTQHLTLVEARGVEDLRDALIHDPRTLIADLAAGRLLTRRFVGETTHHIERRVLASEVRIFLLDGSGSMLGPRARMRDAILVAELSTLIARLNDANRWLTPTLYYRYFNRELGDVVRVSSAGDALLAIERVLGEVRHGGTDIQGALLGSFETLEQARQVPGSELRRAQIVLITDGEAPVDTAAIMAARARIGDVPVGVSVIALGEENTALRAFAREQRAEGQRIFYQFLGDDVLERLAQGQLHTLSLHLPADVDPSAVRDTLGSLINEIASVERTRDGEALARARDEEAALEELGELGPGLTKTFQARILTLVRDRQTLSERFGNWFPLPKQAPSAEAGVQLSVGDQDIQLQNTVKALLLAVAELTELIGSDPFQRQLDAVEMLERLLMENGLSFLQYKKVLERDPSAFETELGRVWAAVATD